MAFSPKKTPVSNGCATSAAGPDIFETAANGLNRVLFPISRYLCYAGAVITLLMALGMIVDLISRFIFNRPLPGMIEYQTFMLVIMGFFSLAYTMVKDGHVSVDILMARFHPDLLAFLKSIFSIWGMFIFLVMSWQSTLRAMDALASNKAADITRIPYYPLYLIVAVGTLMIALVLFSHLLTHLSGLYRSFKSKTPLVFAAILIIAFGIMLSAQVLNLFSIELGKTTAGIIYMAVLLTVLVLGFPVAFSMAFTGLIGLLYLTDGEVVINIVRMNTFDSVAHYYFCVIPFFLLMGFLVLKAGIGTRLYRAGSRIFGRLPGGLAIGTVFGCGGFAAICGESVASAATMGSVSLPEMKRYNYDDSLATGSVAAGGTLGILIPPSIGFIVYGLVTEESIAQLFMAGIIPGIILTLGFAVTIYIQCKLNPQLGPKAEKAGFIDVISSVRDVWQVVLLFTMVIGGIYSGLVTPTEAGGIGAFGALVIALFTPGFNKTKLFEALLQATQMTAMIITILIGVSLLGYFVTMTDIPMLFATYIQGLDVSRYVILVLILLLYLFMGMLMNIIPMMMLTLPILFPTVTALGFDPIWFGVIMVIMMEMGQITPPIGINVFVIHGVAKDMNVPMSTIFKGIVPFIIVEVLVILLLTVFPGIVLFLPGAMDVLPAIE